MPGTPWGRRPNKTTGSGNAALKPPTDSGPGRSQGWRRLPGAPRLAAWYTRNPFLTMWAVLAVGMVAMVVWFGLDAGLTFRQHATLSAIAVLLAWLCAWIIFLEPGA
jgi:hypothetical protein